MLTDNNRLLLEIDKTIREINRETINPAIPKLSLSDLNPVMVLVARARVVYLKELFDIAGVVGNGLPSPDQIDQLKKLRETYEELVNGAQSLEIAIQRGYLDVISKSS
ncbi:hypothetical protein [endosymbiont of Ridgeia piscesae]|jgi:hypothetical protein|uniref:Uncharacterized protein n=1 Tax=endosymbiont of Ridgeia piscesae TaxID=54398 RepID=A0A0T5ZA12_9GAMM|nr:hypothetical protein [endosymbiont of Ridgeia piscesae]KRT55177.1 hypothetical protein Ga0074115_11474 [endosymbiont of Ridgeia piscesae]KRT59603.1 hypothetical protein Ga0076813_15763 [endosymbiont of Ridgeia piscesae]